MSLEKMRFQEIFSLLPSNFKEQQENLIETYVITNLENHWEEIVGPVFYRETRPCKFRNNRLTIYITHSSYRMELNFIKELFFKNINKLFKDIRIHSITYMVGNFMRLPVKEPKKLGTLEGKDKLVEMLNGKMDKEMREKFLDLIRVL